MNPLVAARLRDSIREDLDRRFAERCVARGLLTGEQVRRAEEERGRLREAGEELSLVRALARLDLLPGDRHLEVLDEVLAAPPGRRLGRYEILRETGRGGIGTVYRAYDTALKRMVAVKTIRTDAMPPGAVLENLAREARTLAGLRHPNVVAVYDVGEAEGSPFLAMEFVEGEHLGEVLRRGERPLAALVEILRKAAEGVAAAHAQGIVHRDLKPGNILVDAAGEPRVIDFGLARVLDRKALLAVTGSPAGTPYYMSPEQVADPKAVGPASDVYALGVCLYEIMTGRRPFEGRESYEVFERILRGDPPPPRSLRAGLPVDLETVCLKAIDRDPRRRYPDAGAFAADLSRHLRGEPVEACPPGPPEKFLRFLGRHRARIGVAAALLLVALAVGWAVHLTRESARARALQARLRPIEDLLRETRPFFYVPDADIAGRLRKVRAALEELEGVAREPGASGSADVWTALGTGWHFLGDLPRAEEALRRAERIAPSDGRVHLALGRIALERSIIELFAQDGRSTQERLALSRDLNRRAAAHLARAPAGGAGIERELVEAYRALADGRRQEAERLCREGLARSAGELGAEDFSCLLGSLFEGAERVEHLTRAIRRRPHYPWALLLRGDTHLALDDPERAIRDFDAAIAVHPRLTPAWNDRGVARLKQNDHEGALRDFEEVLRIEPTHLFALLNRAIARLGRGELEAALADCDRALRLNPSLARGWQNRGAIRQRQGDLAGAIGDFDRALSLDPSLTVAWYDRGLARAARLEWPKAVEDYTRAIDLDPRHVEARVARGIARVTTGDREGAFEDFTGAIELDPRQAAARYYRGTLHVEAGKPAAAMADLDEAIRLNPSHVPALVSRAILREGRGELAKAIEDCDAALRVDPRYAEAWFNRGVVRLAQGKAKAAVADLEKALELAPPGWNSRPLAERALEEARRRP